MDNQRTLVIVAVLLVLTMVGCGCGVAVLGGAAFLMTGSSSSGGLASLPPEFDIIEDGLAPPTLTPTPVPDLVLTPPPTPQAGQPATLDILLNTTVPESDLRELATRFLGIQDIPVTVSDTPADHPIGTQLSFWAGNVDTDENFELDATLIYKSENVYFFAENGLDVDADQVRAVVDEFDQGAYHVNRDFFGSEWRPGVDGDPRVYILYARNLGFTVAAYYSSVDQYSKLAHEFSNEKEMFYVNADTVSLYDRDLVGTLTHEFQHMIHWYNDRNETTWMNEGASVLSEVLNGYSSGGFDSSFVSDPDLQLTTWSDGTPNSSSIPHYGASFLFMTYFLERFGPEATQLLVAHPDNGMVAVDAVLDDIGSELDANDFFADWVIANYVDDGSFADGVFTYGAYYNAPSVYGPTETVNGCAQAETQRSVHQYAADYIEINCQSPATFYFTGSQQVQVTPAEIREESPMVFWSNREDESDTRLTRAFDLTGVDSATLRYNAWWQIETNWDYAYLLISTDDGETWTMIETPSGTDDDPNGNNFGWGYHDDSGQPGNAQWIVEEVDLTPWAGQEVLLRFEYVTDAAVNRPGFMVDDISIPEIDYFTDFEDGDGGWLAEGFARIDNRLPQTWILQVIEDNAIRRIPVENGQASIELDGPATIVVSGTAQFTTELAPYSYSLEP